MDNCQSIVDFFESWRINLIAYVLIYFANECPKKSLWRVSKSNISLVKNSFLFVHLSDFKEKQEILVLEIIFRSIICFFPLMTWKKFKKIDFFERRLINV